VTERKQAEDEKERLLISEKAARLDAEEAQRLSAKLLIREESARAEAEAANRLKDEFLATVSHELRTPLNSILGWAQLLRTGTIDDAATARALMTIERNTKTLAQIIEDLLDVSRIITGKLRLDVRPVELESIWLAGSGVKTELPPVSLMFRRTLALKVEAAGHVAPDGGLLTAMMSDPKKVARCCACSGASSSGSEPWKEFTPMIIKNALSPSFG